MITWRLLFLISKVVSQANESQALVISVVEQRKRMGEQASNHYQINIDPQRDLDSKACSVTLEALYNHNHHLPGSQVTTAANDQLSSLKMPVRQNLQDKKMIQETSIKDWL